MKDCNIPGPVECRTEFESQCNTYYHEHVLEEDVPDCVTIKEYKCETVTRGYSSEEVGIYETQRTMKLDVEVNT